MQSVLYDEALLQLTRLWRRKGSGKQQRLAVGHLRLRQAAQDATIALGAFWLLSL